MNYLHRYGTAPYDVAVIHGGPGAVGEMEPVARELATHFGILEPMQTETTLDGQLAELSMVLKKHADLPVSLIGFSWGAWLSYLVTVNFPTLVKKLILVGSGPYDPKYVGQIQQTRLSRLNKDECTEYNAIIAILNDPHAKGKAGCFSRLGQLAAITDGYDPIKPVQPKPKGTKEKLATLMGNKFHDVLLEAQELRRDGSLLKFAEFIQSPVVALHGDYYPHLILGVREPLSAILRDFRMIEIKNCGHKPWIERRAKDKFYEILKEELCVA